MASNGGAVGGGASAGEGGGAGEGNCGRGGGGGQGSGGGEGGGNFNKSKKFQRNTPERDSYGKPIPFKGNGKNKLNWKNKNKEGFHPSPAASSGGGAEGGGKYCGKKEPGGGDWGGKSFGKKEQGGGGKWKTNDYQQQKYQHPHKGNGNNHDWRVNGNQQQSGNKFSNRHGPGPQLPPRPSSSNSSSSSSGGRGGLKFSSSLSAAPSNLPLNSKTDDKNGVKTRGVQKFSNREEMMADFMSKHISPSKVGVISPTLPIRDADTDDARKIANDLKVKEIANLLASIKVPGTGTESPPLPPPRKGFVTLEQEKLPRQEPSSSFPSISPVDHQQSMKHEMTSSVSPAASGARTAVPFDSVFFVPQLLKKSTPTTSEKKSSSDAIVPAPNSEMPSTKNTNPFLSWSWIPPQAQVPPTSTVSTSALMAPTKTENVATSTSVTASSLGSQSQSMKELLEQYRQQREEADAQRIKELELKQSEAKRKASQSPFNKHRVPRTILEQTRLLPIYSRKEELVNLIKDNQFIIVIGETGSGKSTQIPQYLVEAGLHGTRKIAVTQPRRVAAKSLADRVAVETGTIVGKAVGYSVRFDKKISGDTVIKYMTDGMLVRECASESLLDTYSIIIIDEAHERSIHTDVCFGLLKRAAKARSDLKVIISSATLEEEKFSRFFNDAPVFNVSGKGFGVDLIYNPKSEYDYMQGAVDTIIRINRNEPRGDILVFLSGQDEIEQLWDMLDNSSRDVSSSLYDDLIITPIYGALLIEDQQKIFDETPPNCRKVVLATNIAETSLTVEGIVYVIDCGYFKQKEYNPRSGICALVKQRITKFQAIQRAGRAGRTRAGKCYRLYSEFEFKNVMQQAATPEITRCNVESVILDIIAMGIPDPLEFDFMDPPPLEALMEAIEHLQELSALNSEVRLTDLGRRMSEFPLDPPLAKVVIESEKLGCSKEVLKIVALLSTQYQSLFARNKRDRSLADASKAKFDSPEGDLITLLKVYDEWLRYQQISESWCRSNYIQQRHLEEAEDIRVQLQDILSSRGISQGYRGTVCAPHLLSENIRRSFTAGYFRKIALKKKTGHAYQVLGDPVNMEDAFLHPSSSLFNVKQQWVIYHEVMKTTKTYMRGVIGVNPAWIAQYSSEFAEKMRRRGIQLV